MVTSLFKYRSFIWQGALADLRHRYAGTGLGLVWNVLHPLALIAVYSIVFTGIMRGALPEPIPGLDPDSRFQFLLYLCSGLLPWLAFSECVIRGSNAFSENAAYLKKLPIPEQVFVAQSAASATMGLGISFCLLIVVSLLLGLRPTWHWALLPLPLVAMQVIGLGAGLLAGTLNVFFRDVGQLVGILLQVVFWTLPIVYMTNQLPDAFARILYFHPLVPSLETIRALFLFARLPELWAWAGMLAWGTIFMIVAAATFKKLRPEIRDML